MNLCFLWRRASLLCAVLVSLTSRSLYGSPAGEAAEFRTAVLKGCASKLRASYVFPEVAEKVIGGLQEKERSGTYDLISDPQEFAKVLTADLQRLGNDRHLNVRYSSETLPPDDPDDGPRGLPPGLDEILRRRNYGFEKVEILSGNVGYIKLNTFAPGDLAGATASAAMNFVAHADALIIDLRDNTGGLPDLIVLIASHLFDGEPVHLNDIYWRKDGRSVQTWTTPYVQGNRFGKSKAVFIVTSARTFSAAEEFAYDLQSLKRATIVGETTGGGANPGSLVRVADHFSMFVPEGRAINPITKGNWEGVGVKPDIKASREDAVRTAHGEALGELLKRSTDERVREELRRILDATSRPSAG